MEFIVISTHFSGQKTNEICSYIFISVENRMWDSLRKFCTEISYFKWASGFFVVQYCLLHKHLHANKCARCTGHHHCIVMTEHVECLFGSGRFAKLSTFTKMLIGALTRPNCDSKVYRFKLSYWKLCKHARSESSTSRIPIKIDIDARRHFNWYFFWFFSICLAVYIQWMLPSNVLQNAAP